MCEPYLQEPGTPYNDWVFHRLLAATVAEFQATEAIHGYLAIDAPPFHGNHATAFMLREAARQAILSIYRDAVAAGIEAGARDILISHWMAYEHTAVREWYVDPIASGTNDGYGIES